MCQCIVPNWLTYANYISVLFLFFWWVVARYQPEARSACEAPGCDREDSLWMCLVCGFVGCGRYTQHAHGLEHHKLTGHNYAIELQTQRVWDYTGDCYVHRLIQNRVDGKMIELGDPNEVEQSGKLGEALAKSMHGELIKEYETLLAQTLDTQRHYYDGQIATLGAELERVRRQLEMSKSAFAEQQIELEAARQKIALLEAG